MSNFSGFSRRKFLTTAAASLQSAECQDAPGYRCILGGELTRCSPGCVEPATQDSRPRLPAILTTKI